MRVTTPGFLSELKLRQIYCGGVMYVVAGWVIVRVGAALLNPLLQKLRLHIAPDRAFTSIMLMLALLELRNLYRKINDRRRRTLRGTHGR